MTDRAASVYSAGVLWEAVPECRHLLSEALPHQYFHGGAGARRTEQQRGPRRIHRRRVVAPDPSPPLDRLDQSGAPAA